MARILLANSQPLFNEALEALLTHDAEHEVVGHSSSPEEVLAMTCRCLPDLVLVDAAIGFGGSPGVVGKTYSAALVLRVTRSVLAGEAVVPRAVQLPLLRRLTAGEQAEGSPLARLSDRERQVL